MATSRLLPSIWANFDRLHGEMDRLLEGWGVEMPRQVGRAFPPLNIWEDEEAFHVEAELPGLVREDLTLSVTNRNQLLIQGERRAVENDTGRWHRREREFGQFQRMIKLPVPIDADRIEATLEEGVLHITLPRGEEARPRKITVKAS